MYKETQAKTYCFSSLPEKIKSPTTGKFARNIHLPRFSKSIVSVTSSVKLSINVLNKNEEVIGEKLAEKKTKMFSSMH